MRTINVTGTGDISVVPDQIQVEMNVSGIKNDYEDAVKAASENGRLLKQAVERAGLDPKELKTTNFKVTPRYKQHQDNNGNWRDIFVGYQFAHYLNIAFDCDNELLGKVLYEIANYNNFNTDYELSLTSTPDNTRFDVLYTVKDMESVKKQLLKSAIEDARCKAEIMAAAAHVGLGDIVQISYGQAEPSLYSKPFAATPMLGASLDESSCYDIDIDPDDISVNDTVTVIYEIKK